MVPSTTPSSPTYCRVDTSSLGTDTATDGTDKNGNSKNQQPRLVVVRYYLDRPGYDLHNSSSRVWKDPPAIVKAPDISAFLEEQEIIPPTSTITTTTTLVEAFLDTFGSFMVLEICAENGIEFDFTETTPQRPGILSIRLTDLRDQDGGGGGLQKQFSQAQIPQRCNTSPVGLFAFSMTVCFDALAVLDDLSDSAVEDSWVLIFGPYALFVSGLLQFVVGLNEIARNNVFGATAFLGFGCFWLANGTILILRFYFPEQISEDLTGTSVVGNFVRELMIMIFSCTLWYQSLTMNKLLTGLLSTLIVYLLFAALTGWVVAAKWIKMILGFVLTVEGLYMFFAELTNEVYQHEKINMHLWNKKGSSSELVGAAGRINKLQSRAIELRRASIDTRASTARH
jgi:succinate-acetate transporter protein